MPSINKAAGKKKTIQKKPAPAPAKIPSAKELFALRWISETELLELLGISDRTLLRYREQKLLYAYSFGRCNFYSIDEIDEMLRKRRK
ncbi:MAG: helix-turn-helix domain-containing protein [Ferruginibacter sp.]